MNAVYNDIGLEEWLNERLNDLGNRSDALKEALEAIDEEKKAVSIAYKAIWNYKNGVEQSPEGFIETINKKVVIKTGERLQKNRGRETRALILDMLRAGPVYKKELIKKVMLEQDITHSGVIYHIGYLIDEDMIEPSFLLSGQVLMLKGERKDHD
jgi:hypothetical protein